MRTIFVFGFMIMGKELQEDLKFAIFTNWLDTRLEMETPPFWGVFREVFGTPYYIWLIEY